MNVQYNEQSLLQTTHICLAIIFCMFNFKNDTFVLKKQNSYLRNTLAKSFDMFINFLDEKANCELAVVNNVGRATYYWKKNHLSSLSSQPEEAKSRRRATLSEERCR